MDGLIDGSMNEWINERMNVCLRFQLDGVDELRIKIQKATTLHVCYFKDDVWVISDENEHMSWKILMFSWMTHANENFGV
jgi:hypothetical protein